MHPRILTSYSEIQEFLPILQKHADQNRVSLGFFPTSSYNDTALQGRLWVAIDENSKNYVGHLFFGGRYPHLKIFQLFILKEYRQLRIASMLLDKLVEYGESRSYLTIVSRVAADLASNKFWERADFQLIRQKPGGKTRGRIINIRIKELNTPSLFKNANLNIQRSNSLETIGYSNKPLVSSPSYAIDLNILFDVIRERSKNNDLALLLGAAFNNQLNNHRLKTVG